MAKVKDKKAVLERLFRHMGILKAEDMIVVKITTGALYLAWGADPKGVYNGIWGTDVTMYGEKKFVMRQIEMRPGQSGRDTRIALEMDALGAIELMDDSGLAKVVDA